MAIPLGESSVRAILLDIEGTTTPVDFVYKTLFPYARERSEEFLRKHWSDPDVRKDADALRAQHHADTTANLGPPLWVSGTPERELSSAIRYVDWLMGCDSKCSPLKSLQGKIWREGYAKGELHGEVFSDVPPAMIRWSRQGKKICIFSSGSVLAQKLLFSTTAAGDLTHRIEAYFDTSIGTKGNPQSYQRIAELLAFPTHEILFISDVVQEVDAASDAGMLTALCVRNEPSDETEAEAKAKAKRHPLIRSFDPVFPDERSNGVFSTDN